VFDAREIGCVGGFGKCHDICSSVRFICIIIGSWLEG
ncbi:MAG: hypothetical protein ACI9TH_000974, partial [Kiritimatiellia bacterium]